MITLFFSEGSSKRKQTYESLPSSDNQYKFNDLTITIRKGDITDEKADCIVNSSNAELDLSRGMYVLHMFVLYHVI